MQGNCGSLQPFNLIQLHAAPLQASAEHAYARACVPRRQPSSRAERARARRAAVIVSNHVSYLDILVHMSHSAPSFVARGNTVDLPLIGVVRRAPTRVVGRPRARWALPACMLGAHMGASWRAWRLTLRAPAAASTSSGHVGGLCVKNRRYMSLRRPLRHCPHSGAPVHVYRGACQRAPEPGGVRAQQASAVHIRQPWLQNEERRGCGAALCDALMPVMPPCPGRMCCALLLPTGTRFLPLTGLLMQRTGRGCSCMPGV